MRLARWGLVVVLLGAGIGHGQTTQEAYTLWLKGSYGQALEAYESVKDADPADLADLALGKARCLRSVGRFGESLEAIEKGLKERPEDPRLLAALGDLHFFHGRHAEALRAADRTIQIDGKNLAARWVRARVLSATGQYEAANGEFEWFIGYYNENQPADPEELLLVALAVSEFARWNKLPDEFDFILNTLLVDAIEANEHFWPAAWYSGVLLVEKYNKAEGAPELQKALKINPNAAEALVGLGQAALQDHDFLTGPQYADQALAICPNLPSALRLRADFLLADSKTDAALEQLQKALAIDPASEETQGRLAACWCLRRESERASAVEKEVRARNPRPGIYYATLADQLETRRQFDRAEESYRTAIDLAPHLAGPLNGLGMLYMRIGKEAEARAIFTRARELDPYHVRVLNMHKVLGHLEHYESILSDHYEVRIDPKLDKMLGQYMSEYLESIHPTLCKRFGYEPPGRSLIEVLVDHQWFSARVVGLPSIGTVGACTGKVVALASPRSLRSPYHWARVLTHEVTHIITLQQTNFNIPHWFTEALAVHAEGYARPQVWNSLLAERVPKGELFDLSNINHSFVRPKRPEDWQMAYCQSLLYAEYMIDRFGEGTIGRLLEAYRQGMETETAIPHVFGVPLAKFEEGYRSYLQEEVKGLRPAAQSLSFAEAEEALRKDPENPDLAAQLSLHHHRRRNNAQARELAEKTLAAKPNHPLALYVLARMELSIGKVDEALQILEPGLDPKDPDLRLLELLAAIRVRRKEYPQAAALYRQGAQIEPLATKWREGLARVQLLSGESSELAESLEQLARMESDDLAVRKKLCELSLKAENWTAAERWARETLYIDISQVDAHRTLAQAALAQKKYDLAARECNAARSLGGTDEGVALDLAEAFLEMGRAAPASEQLQAILEKDPANQRAGELMKRAQELMKRPQP